MSEEDTVKFFTGKDVLSNFYVCNLNYHGRIYKTSEHLYQCRKFRYRGCSRTNIDYSEEIRLSNTPGIAKKLGSQKRGGTYSWQTTATKIIDRYPDATINPRWEDIKITVMRHILKLKWEQCSLFRKTLRNTGDKKIVENSPYDTFWGVGKNGEGKNMLGRLLMKLRDKNK